MKFIAIPVAIITGGSSLWGDEWKASLAPGLIQPEVFQIADPELEVTVWAKSPQLFNPTNMDIDHHGRIWVAEGVNYRGKKGTRPSGDRIVVLQDTNGDGSCDHSHTFVQEKSLIAPLGVAVFDNLVIVSQPPDLIAYTDVDRDLRFDPEIDKREILLTGFNAINHDHGLHSVQAGPDGKLYFNNGNCGGVFTDRSGKTFYLGGTYGERGGNWVVDHLKVTGKTSDDGHVWTSGFAVRMNPDGSQAEIVSHGLRNSYEQVLTSRGDMFQNDNDDPRACRTSYALEYGCAGYFTRDGRQRNKAVKRPGQSFARMHWRQDDPGTMDAGDVYGGGAPTGITFYENGALNPKWNGLLLSCDAALNTILGYRPKPQIASFEMNRFDFLTSNPKKEFRGVDFTGGATDQSKPTTYFRPSDVTVGPDGAIYFCDWFDPRVGASSHLDESFSGAIYRIAPQGFGSLVPKIDLSTTSGLITALRSPANNTRHLGFRGLKAKGSQVLPLVLPLLRDQNKWIAARAVWLLPYLGSEGLKVCEKILESKDAEQRVLALRALRRSGKIITLHARRLASDPSARVRAEVALSLRDLPVAGTADIFVELARHCDTSDKNSLEAFGLGAAGQESEIWLALREGLKPGLPEEWTESFSRLTWRLWGAASLDDLKLRALSSSLTMEARHFAVESIAFINDPRAAQVMLDLAAENSPVRGEAIAWLLRNLPGEWSKYHLARHLRNRGIYDPDRIELAAAPVPKAIEGNKRGDVAAILKLTGDVIRGRGVAARCVLCHKIDGVGPEYGPDLKGWAARQSREAVIRSIAEPSAGIAQGFQGSELILHDGTVIHGIEFNNSELGRNDAPPVVIQSAGGLTQLVPKDRIEKRTSLARSLMYDPATLQLTGQDIADVAAWLQTYH